MYESKHIAGQSVFKVGNLPVALQFKTAGRDQLGGFWLPNNFMLKDYKTWLDRRLDLLRRQLLSSSAGYAQTSN